MEPTIQNSDIVFSETLSCHFYSIQKYVTILHCSNFPQICFVFATDYTFYLESCPCLLLLTILMFINLNFFLLDKGNKIHNQLEMCMIWCISDLNPDHEFAY